MKRIRSRFDFVALYEASSSGDQQHRGRQRLLLHAHSRSGEIRSRCDCHRGTEGEISSTPNIFEPLAAYGTALSDKLNNA